MRQLTSLTSVLLVAAAAGCTADTDRSQPVEPIRSGQTEIAALFSEPEFSEWSAPERLDISSDANEITPAISTDGLALYFASVRTGGVGMSDIWVSTRASTTASWGTPVNLGAPVNSVVNEVGPSLSIDGSHLFFSSSRPSSADEIGVCGAGAATPEKPHCDNDIWVSRRSCDHAACSWGTPSNLGPGVNTAFFEGGQALWGVHLYFNRGATANAIPGAPLAGPPADIYLSRMGLSYSSHDGISVAFGTAVAVAELNHAEAVDQRPTLRLDGRELYFTSTRDGTPDIWVSKRRTILGAWGTPQRVAALSSDAQDLHPSLSADGTTMYLASNRDGNLDLYVSRRTRIR